MSKPTQLPRWADGGGAVTTPEPTEGKKSDGWTYGESPPRQYFNWWMNRVYQWCSYLDGITNEALTWAAKHTFNAGLASGVAPSGANDVVRLADVASGSTAGLMSATDKTKLDNAVSAATASRLVLRDANGRAQFADPSAAQDADTKAARDAAIAAAGSAFTIGAGSNWTLNAQVGRAVGKLANIVIEATAAAGASWNAIAALPVGARPAVNVRAFGQVWDVSAATFYPAMFLIGMDGVIQLEKYDNGASLVAPFAIGLDYVWLYATYPTS